MNWVKPEGAFCLEPPPEQTARSRTKRKRRDVKETDRSVATGTSEQVAQSQLDGTWVEKFAPKSRSDLAVHRDKVELVYRSVMAKLSNKSAGAVFLLCGPAGSGKTATLRCLAADEGLTICEWVNPISLTAKHEYSLDWDFGGTTGQVEQFEDFLFQSSRYASLLDDDSGKRLVLVEDLPNIFIREPKSLHSVLRMCRRTAIAPLVFIVSDSSDKLEYRLFPDDILRELDITKITFNAIAPTFVSKALCTLLDAAVRTQAITHEPTADDIESIVAASNGDIRSAINALEFFCSPQQGLPKVARSFGSTTKKSQWSGGGRKRRKTPARTDTYSGGIGRDTPLSLFHSLGKILHGKCRQLDQSSTELANETDLPSSDSLSVSTPEKHSTSSNSPEAVFERAAISGETFSLFLHHNMPDFAADIAAAAECAEWFCHGDVLASEWTSDNVMESYAVSVVTRGLTASLSSSAGKSAGWKPLGKPQWMASLRHVKQKLFDLRVAFKGQHSTGRELQLDRVPYLALLREHGPPLSNTRKALVDEIGTLAHANSSRFSTHWGGKGLSDQDVADGWEVENTVDYTCKSTQEAPECPEYSDEEVVIEEYDD